MTIGTTFRGEILDLIYKGIPIANIADIAASSPLTNVYVSLHTGDPSAGDQTTNEVNYTGYARVAVAVGSGWTRTGNSISPTANIVFPKGTAGSGTATYASVGTEASGTGKILDSGLLSLPIETGNGVMPQIETTATITRT